MSQSVIGALRVNLGIDSAQFIRGIQNAQSAAQQMGRNFQRLGRQLSLGLTAPIAGFGGLALRTAGDFESSMNRVAAVSGATGEQLGALRDQAKELGRTTQFSASQAADAMGFLAMAGFNAEEVFSSLPGTLQLAAAAQMDLGRSADIVSNILTGYRMEVEDLGRVNDVLVETFTSTNTTLEQLGEAMKFAGPVAAAAGVQFEEAAAAIGLMGNAGIQGSMAGTALRGALVRMLNPTRSVEAAIAELNLEADEAADLMDAMEGATDDLEGVMKELGITFKDAEGNLLPLVDVIAQLEPHADNAGAMMAIFGQRAGPAMAGVIGQGSDALRELTAELENSGGAADRIANVQMEGFNGAMRELRSAFEGLQIAVGESGLLEFATEFVRGLSGLVRQISEINPKIVRFATVIAGVAAAFGPVLLALGTMLVILGGPAAGIILAVSLLTAGIVAFWPEVTRAADAVRDFGEDMRTLGRDGIEFVKEKIRELIDWVAQLPERFREAGANMMRGLVDGVRENASSVRDAITGAVSDGYDSTLRFLRIRSPSRLFAEVGQNIMLGLGGGIRETAQVPVQEVRNVAGELVATVEEASGEISGLFERAFVGIVTGTTNARNAIASLLQDLARLAAQSAFRGLMDGFGGGGGGGLFSWIFGGGKAMGGPVSAGTTYMVGERGPELFTPGTSGNITPNHKLGGGQGQLIISLDPNLRAEMRGEMQGVVIQGLSEYDRTQLPSSVRRVNADPRRTR